MILKDGEVAEEFYLDKKIIQNVNLYRFTSDSVLLSRFVKAKTGERVADFCAGCGVVGFHFLCLNPSVESLTLFEMQPAMCDMAKRSAEMNGFLCEIDEGRLQDIPRDFDDKFSLVLCNPPYERGGFENASYERAICRKEITINLKEIVDAAFRTLKFGGRFAVVNRADRSAELIYLLKQRGLEPKRLQFVSGGLNKPPYLVMIEARKGGREGIEILPAAVN